MSVKEHVAAISHAVSVRSPLSCLPSPSDGRGAAGGRTTAQPLLLRLPNDVWYKILMYTDIVTIMKCRVICMQLHQVAYEILKGYRQVSLFQLFSDMKEKPSKEEVINTLNVLPEMSELTIRVPDTLFRFNVADTFCETHTSSRLRSVIFYSCDIRWKNMSRFLSTCGNVDSLTLFGHDSVNDEFCSSLIDYCHDYTRSSKSRRRRRFQSFSLCGTRNVSKRIITRIIDGYLAETVTFLALGQLDHVEIGVHENQSHPRYDLQRDNDSDINENLGLETKLVLNTNQHLRRLTIGMKGVNRVTSLSINRCPLYSFRILSSNSSDSSASSLPIKQLSLTYGRWLSRIQNNIANAFANVEHLDLTSCDAMRPTTMNQLFGLSSVKIMHQLRTLVLSDTLIETLSLCDYHLLCKVDAQRCVMLKNVVVNQCPVLNDLQLEPGAMSLESVDITVRSSCVVKGMPQWIQATPKMDGDDELKSYKFSLS